MKTLPARQLLLVAALLLGSVFAQETESAGEWTEADSKLANHYIAILQADPEYGSVIDLLWKLYDEKENLPLLLDYFAGESDAGNETATLLYAHLLRKKGEIGKARALYDQVLKRAPESVPALLALAEISEDQGRSSKAFSLYNRLADLVSVDTEEGLQILLRKADLQQAQGQSDDAVQIWNEILKAYPSRDELRRSIVGRLIEAGETGAALEILRGLVEKSEPAARLPSLFELHRIYEFSGDFDNAVATAREALALLHFRHHQYGDLFAKLVRIHERFDQLEELEASFAAQVSEANPTEKSLSDLAGFYALTANPLAEEATLARLVAQRPLASEYRVRLAGVRMRNDRYAEAGAALDPIFESGEELPLSIVLLRTRIAIRAGETDNGIEYLRDFLASAKSDGRAVEQIIAFAREHYLDGLVEELLRAAESPVELARFLHARGSREEAIKLLESYADDEAESTERSAEVARILGELGETRRALAAIDHAIAGSPDEAALQQLRVDLLVEAENITEAMAQLETLWESGANLAAKSEIDQRIFTLLRAYYTEDREPDPDENLLKNGNIQSIAQYRRLAAAANRVGRPTDEPPPPELIAFYDQIKKTAEENPTTGNRYRVAWWAFKLQDNQECYEQLTTATEEAGGPVYEVEKLLLDLAELNERPTLMVRHLTALAEIDPDNADKWLQKRAEMEFELGNEDAALRQLRALAAKPDATMETLATLARVYRRQGSTGRQVEVWERAYGEADSYEKRQIVKQYATALIDDGKPERALEIELDLLESETDPTQREKQLDAMLTIARTHFLVDSLLGRFTEIARQKPFDAFYPESLSKIHIAAGDESAAFASLKQAHYLSGGEERFLGELGRLADRIGDSDAAIYFRRQELTRDGGDVESWESLVAMYENDLRVPEADQLRERLEKKFGTNPDFLQSLVDHYVKSGDLRGAERVLNRLVALRDWDLPSRFHLGLIEMERGRREEALATFSAVIAATDGITYPVGFGGRLFPLIRVSQLSREDQLSPGTELDPFVFSIESFPFQGGSLQDEIAGDLQREHPEFRMRPREDHLLRLRAIEEAGGIVSELGRRDRFLENWKGSDRPVFEKIWAARHSGDTSFLLELLAGRKEPVTHPDLFIEAYGMLLTRDSIAIEEWIGRPANTSATQHPRSLYITLAAFIFLKDYRDDPLFDTEVVFSALDRVALQNEISIHIFSELRRAQRFADTLRFSELVTEGTLGKKGDFLYATSQVAGWAGEKDQRITYLDRSLAARRNLVWLTNTETYFAALTERLSLFESDFERRNYLERITRGGIDENVFEILSNLAVHQYDPAIGKVRALVDAEQSVFRESVDDPARARVQQTWDWKKQSRLFDFARHRIPLRKGYADALAEALRGPAIFTGGDESILSEYEETLIEREITKLETRTAPERAALVTELRSRLVAPESAFALARALERDGYHREAIPIYLAEVYAKNRDYAPLQGLFDASAEALEPKSALAIISQIESGEFQAPPGLTIDYLNEQHARFLFIALDVERLAKLARPPLTKDRAAKIGTGHLPYQDALVDVYRLTGRSDELFDLLEAMQERDEISEKQKLLAGEMLLTEGRSEEALEWFRSIPLDQSESATERIAIERQITILEMLGFPDEDALVHLAKISLDQQPASLTRKVALALHEAGMTEGAISILERLRRSTSSREKQVETTLAILCVKKESGRPVEAWRDDVESLLRDAGDEGAAIYGEEIIELLGGVEGLTWPESGGWLGELLEAAALDKFEPAVRDAVREERSANRDVILAHLPAFGDAGVALAEEIVAALGKPGTGILSHEPERQIRFFHQIGDRERLLEVYQALLTEARSDVFHQAGLEDWNPTLTTRQKVPRLLADLGETELAANLYRQYHDTISSYRWDDEGFLDDYLRFLIETGAYRRADSILGEILQKSLRVDLRLFPQLYQQWGKTADWKERADSLALTRGRIAIVREWFRALAQGRELVPAR